MWLKFLVYAGLSFAQYVGEIMLFWAVVRLKNSEKVDQKGLLNSFKGDIFFAIFENFEEATFNLALFLCLH